MRPFAGPPVVGNPRTVRFCAAFIMPLPFGFPLTYPTSYSVFAAYLATSAMFAVGILYAEIGALVLRPCS